MNPNTTKTILTGLLPFMTNPVTIALVGAGAVALTVYGIFTKGDVEEKDNGSQTVPNGSKSLAKPLKRAIQTVPATVSEPLQTMVIETAEESLDAVQDGLNTYTETSNDVIAEEAVKKEIIRKAMSELGKRSGAARARKRDSS